MTACTFFGHRDCPDGIKAELYKAIEQLITEKGVDTFYVGTQGSFDRMAYAALVELRLRYSRIKVYCVLAYMPKPGDTDTTDAIVPEGIENAHPRYAIIHRNNWMIDRSDYVIAYVTHSFGGAYQAVERAKKREKIVITLSA